MKNTKFYACETTNLDDPYTGKEEVWEAISPKSISIQQNYLNPFNSKTNIELEINETCQKQTGLKVYNIDGMEIKTLLNKNLSAGRYKFEYYVQDTPVGAYFYRLTRGNDTISWKMTILK